VDFAEPETGHIFSREDSVRAIIRRRLSSDMSYVTAYIVLRRTMAPHSGCIQ